MKRDGRKDNNTKRVKCMFAEKILSEIETPAKSAIPEKVFIGLKEFARFAIWGTGRAGRYAIEQCVLRGISPYCVYDSFPHEAGETFLGLPLLKADLPALRASNQVVLICCSRLYKIAQVLDEWDIPFLEWDTGLINTFTVGEPLNELMRKNKERIEAVFDLLADEKSKKTYEAILKYRLTGNKEFVRSVYEAKIYFGNDVVPRVGCDAFIDCGAFTGDTLESFKNHPLCKCEKYYAMEPDPDNYEKLCSFIREKNYDGVLAFSVAAWNERTKLKFAANGFENSAISENGAITVQADRIDNIVEKRFTVGFVKMDIEGGEMQALDGAYETIKRDRPTLAISIYHRKVDLWEIPLRIHALNPDYRLYIRHHTQEVDDTVCYAKCY